MKLFFERYLSKLLRFSTVGVVVTLTSLSLTFLFLKIIGTPLYITYILIYALTIFLSYILNLKWTFKSIHSKRKMIYYFLTYLSGMLLGVLVLKFYKSTLPFENWLLSYLVIPVTMTWNFFFSSKILSKVHING